ncbi:DedA family protein [Terrilactibacillus sp. S3-3]|nr:DedA family protein [Terrilactibacillus sp. S3-3]
MSQLIMELLNGIMHLGYWGVALALAIEVIPSELVLAYGGFMVSLGRLQFSLVVIAATCGMLIAQLILYWIGSFGGRPFLDKYGKYFLIHKRHLDLLSERWFQKYGAGVVFFARFVPVLRQAISIPAGIAKMPLKTFLLFTILATTVSWAILFVFLGEKLGQNWGTIHQVAAPYVDTIAAVIVGLFVIYLAVKYIRSRRLKP